MAATQQHIRRQLAERRCALAMKALLDAGQLANAVSAKEFPAQAPVQLCALLEGVAKKATERIPKLSADNPQHALSQADLLCLLAREIAEHVRYAERAVTLETPWSIVETVAEYGQRLYESPVCFIVRPKWSYNYSLVGEFKAYYLDKLQTLFPQSQPSDLIKAIFADSQPSHSGDACPDIWAISFPRLEKSNTLLHACFAHELGHFVSAEWVGNELPRSGLLDKLRGRLLDHIKQDTTDPIQIALKLADLYQQSQIVLKRGLEELLADLAAVLLFGPCVPFAMCHIATKAALRDRPSEANEYYPPWGYRLHVLFRTAQTEVFSQAAIILEGNGFENARTLVKEFIQQVREFIGSKDTCLDLKNWPPAIRYAYEVIEQALPNLEKWVGNRIKDVKYFGEAEHLAHLCADIEAGIPPLLMRAEGEVRTDFRHILNAGWLYLITQIKETMNSLTNEAAAYRTERRRLDLLLLKGIESSYLLQHHIAKEPGSTP